MVQHYLLSLTVSDSGWNTRQSTCEEPSVDLFLFTMFPAEEEMHSAPSIEGCCVYLRLPVCSSPNLPWRSAAGCWQLGWWAELVNLGLSENRRNNRQDILFFIGLTGKIYRWVNAVNGSCGVCSLSTFTWHSFTETRIIGLARLWLNY